jgi:hypothetical protein
MVSRAKLLPLAVAATTASHSVLAQSPQESAQDNVPTYHAMAGLHHFQTLIATKDRLYVGADGQVYAFTF